MQKGLWLVSWSGTCYWSQHKAASNCWSRTYHLPVCFETATAYIWLLIWLILHSVAYWHLFITDHIPSVLWRCWLGGRKGTRPVKNWVLDCRHSYLSGQGADLHMAQMMPLPLTVSCFSKIQIGFTFLLLAHLGSPRKRAVKRVWVYGSWA